MIKKKSLRMSYINKSIEKKNYYYDIFIKPINYTVCTYILSKKKPKIFNISQYKTCCFITVFTYHLKDNYRSQPLLLQYSSNSIRQLTINPSAGNQLQVQRN